LAAIANPLDYETYPIETLSVNSNGSNNMIKIAENSKAKYVFFSSSEVYGNYDSLPRGSLSETSGSRIVLNQKRSPYVVGKCFGEEITINLCMNKGIEYLIIRPFNIYGPKMDLMTKYGRVIPNFCIWGLLGQPLKIHGDGTQIRSFCHIDDLINALNLLINSNFKNNSINIGYPQPISILDLARLISEILEMEENYIFVERYEFEPFIRIPDINKIKSIIGWKPQIDLRTGLMRTIEWFKTEGIKEYNRL
jgi:nucleoside-diphosphate-sugar epimerase